MKPKEIVELENLLSKRLNKSVELVQKTLDEMKDHGGSFAYSLNSANEVNGLGFIFGKVRDISFIKSFPKLEVLDLSDCELENLQDELFELKELSHLSISANPISHIPKNILRLKKLEYLDMGFVNSHVYTPVEFPNFLQNLKNLKHLLIHGNGLTEIPQWIYELKNLESLNIYNNHITTISEKILNLDKLNDINTLYLEITSPPPNIVKLGAKAIKAYFRGLELGYIENNHIKIILVGNAHVGKTMLFNYLTKAKTPIDFAGSTHGIRVGNFNIEVEKGQTVNINLWDFGGQEYYHSTHRLFFSDNVLYLLLWEQETDKYGNYTFTSEQDTIISSQGLQYFNPPISSQITTEGFPVIDWVNNIRFFSNDSPILLVQNKIDIQEPKYNFRELEEDIPNTRISLKELEGIEELDKLIKKSIKKLKHYKYKIPVDWQKVVEFIQSIKSNYIEYEVLKSECKKWNKELFNELPEVLGFFHERGDILWMGNNNLLRKYIFKFNQHSQITDVIYKILRREIADKYNGEFTKEYVIKFLDKNEVEKIDFYLEIMKEFELIFVNKSKNNFVAPQYLPKKCPNEQVLNWALKTNPKLVFKFHFPIYLSKNLFLRFLSHYGTNNIDSLYWKYGLVFSLNEKTVYATYNYQEKTISISVQEQDKTTIQEIYNWFENEFPKNTEISVGKDFEKLEDVRNDKYRSIYQNDFWFVFDEKAKVASKEITLNQEINPVIQKALNNLESANYRGYFEEMDNIIPVSMSTTYHDLKQIFIAGMHKHNFNQQLGLFASEVNKNISQK